MAGVFRAVEVVPADEALAALRSGKFGAPDSPVVVKADGLAAGKGVIVAPSRRDAERAIADLAAGTLVAAEATKQLLIEEALEGREVSVLLFTDGRDYALMPAARDHKRIGENDTGPNTGGMGAITDHSVLDKNTLDRIVREVVEPTLRGASEEGFPFRGILFVGLMLTAAGPKVLEFHTQLCQRRFQFLFLLKTGMVCCESDSRNSPSNRVFSIAITACAAKFVTSSICFLVNGRTS